MPYLYWVYTNVIYYFNIYSFLSIKLKYIIDKSLFCHLTNQHLVLVDNNVQARNL